MEIIVRTFDHKPERYRHALDQVRAVLRDETDLIAGLANTSAALRLLLPGLNWVGFYLMRNGGLVVGPFQGKPAVSHIAVGAGVCGTAAQTLQPQLVPDVHQHCNHIACDLASASEVVLPLFARGALFGVLDMDSPTVRHFDEEDLAGLQPIADALGEWIGQTAE